MVEKKKVNVFEIEYETNEMTWKVKIAGWSKEDAFGYLSKMLKKTSYKITGFTSVTAIDAITTQVTDDIIKANTSGTLTGKPKFDKTEKPKTDIKEESKEEDNTTAKKSTMKKK